MMRIRKDLGGCVYVAGRRLFAGDPIPQGAKVSDWLIDQDIDSSLLVDGDITLHHDDNDAPIDDDQDDHDNDPADSEDDADEEDVDDEEELVEKPTRADSKAAWFAYAESLDALEQDATIDDYSKADLIDLVG